jgi:NAD+ synthase (glutamine-hydrolysing)
MNKTKDYLAKVRKKTGFSDYKIAQKYDINQSNLSKYRSGKATLSEAHAWLFADILNKNPAEVVAHTKLEHAKMKGDKGKLIFWQERLKSLENIPKSIKIDIAQINPVVGDLDNNAQKIIELSLQAAERHCDLLIFPELSLTGYFPEDLLFRAGFIQQVEDKISLIKNRIPEGLSIIFGAPHRENNHLYNAGFLIQAGNIRIYHKQNLPNHSVFDEKRYFTAGDKAFIFTIKNQRIALLICADIWDSETVKETAKYGVQSIVSINASPFHVGKHQCRIDEVKKRVLDNKVEFIYVNLVGGQDEIIFDGGSFIMNAEAQITRQLPFFETLSNTPEEIFEETSIEQTIYTALVLATKDYIEKNDAFNGALIGLSGGIDSALTLAIAADAIGAENVQAVMMPYTYTSGMSLEDAKNQAKLMNIDYQEINIHPMIAAFNSQLNPLFNGLSADTTEENLQARVRATLLMAISNKLGKIVLTTGNKSEMAVGYATLYGDMSGGFAPLKDVAKTMVYRLARYRNAQSHVIPERVIEREPSAELAPNQIDQDSLPPYDELDAILELFIEKRHSIKEIVNLGFNPHTVARISRLVLNNEYKRRQSAPGPKISQNAFGKERRYPMTSKFKP